MKKNNFNSELNDLCKIVENTPLDDRFSLDYNTCTDSYYIDYKLSRHIGEVCQEYCVDSWMDIYKYMQELYPGDDFYKLKALLSKMIYNSKREKESKISSVNLHNYTL